MNSLNYKEIEVLIGAHKPGFTLAQPFYCSRSVFSSDMDKVISRKWILVDHISRIPDKGNYFLFEVGEESIIIIRANDDDVFAFFNVCRHRGSKICKDREGKKNLLVCPYHAWSYELNGKLKEARMMPDDFNKNENNLHPCHIKILHGLIFICLSYEAPPDFDADFTRFESLLDFHGFENAKIAEKRNYPTAANWKLVVENFLECYHCGPAHPEYCSIHPEDQVLAIGAGPGSGPEDASGKYQAVWDEWKQKVAAMGHPLDEVNEEEDSTHMTHLYRYPLSDRGFLSETKDGSPACKKLMGKFRQNDGGITVFSFSPVGYILAANDYAMMIRFTPRNVMFTDVEVTWLVNENAREGTDYHRDEVAWFWDVTTIQDKTITEDNQLGIRSSRYQPGRYSEHEGRVLVFLKWYLANLSSV